MRILFGLAIVGTFGLAACGESADPVDEARRDLAEMCRRDPPPSVDAETYCTCVVDKAFEGRSAAGLAQMSESETESLGASASTECLGEMLAGQATPPSGPAAASTAGTPQNKAAEAVDDAIDDSQ